MWEHYDTPTCGRWSLVLYDKIYYFKEVNPMSISINVSEDNKQRFRNFATILYPESAPPDWLDYLRDLHMPIFVSPLHDMDVNPENEPKKAHYHILLMFEGKKSPKQIIDLLKPINAVGLEIVCSLRSYARYLIHADDANKFQYQGEKVICLGGSDYFGICNLAVDKYNTIGEMMDFCAASHIVSFSYFMRLCRLEHFDWYRVLCDKASYVMVEYLKSLAWEISNYGDSLNPEEHPFDNSDLLTFPPKNTEV